MPNQPISPPFDAQGLVDKAYLNNLYVYRAVNYIANNISGLPFRAGKEKNGTFRATHPLARLLGPAPGSPNPMWAPSMFWRYSIAQYLVMGKVAWLPERDGSGRIVGLWPLPAQYVRPVLADPDSREPSYFSRYEYGVAGNAGFRKFGLDELIYLWRPSLADPRQPESIVQVAAPEINIATMIRQFDAAFLKNGGVPSHLVVTDVFPEDSERQAFRNQFVRQFGGAENAHKPMFAERDIEMGEDGAKLDPVQVIKVGQSQIDSQMDQLRDSKISDVTVVLGVPLSLLGESRVQKYSNMQEDRKNAWTETIRPIYRDLEDLVNTHLSPRFDKETVGWFDIEHINELRPTPRFNDEYAPALVQAGIISENEYRADRGLPPREDVPEFKQVIEAEKALPAAEPPAQGLTPEVTADSPPAALKPRKKDTPAAPAAKPKLTVVRSIREDHLDVARTLAEGLVRDMATAMEKRSAGRRKDRPALDAPYWARRVQTTLGPSLLQAGATQTQIGILAGGLVSAVQARSALGVVRGLVDGVFTTVPADRVEQALIGLATGTVERENALRIVQGGGE